MKVKKWFAKLPKELRENEITNPELEIELDSTAIVKGLNWIKSKEGKDYWQSFYRCLLWAEGDDTQLSTPFEETDWVDDFVASQLKAKKEMEAVIAKMHTEVLPMKLDDILTNPNYWNVIKPPIETISDVSKSKFYTPPTPQPPKTTIITIEVTDNCIKVSGGASWYECYGIIAAALKSIKENLNPQLAPTKSSQVAERLAERTD